VDFFLDRAIPLFFLALMLFTNEFFTPSLLAFFLDFFAAFFPADPLSLAVAIALNQVHKEREKSVPIRATDAC
jgi:hypothetical protein